MSDVPNETHTSKPNRIQHLEALVKKYKILSDAAVDAIAIVEGDTIRYINKAFSETFGYGRKDIKGNSIFTMLTPAVHDILEDALHTEDYAIFPTIGKRKDHSTFTAEVHVEPCSDLPYMAVIIRDISKRKALEKQLNRTESEYKQLFEDTKDAIYISSKKGKFLDVNHAALELLGYTKNEMLEMDILNLYAHPEDRKTFINHIETKGAINDFEVQLIRKDDTIIDCLLSSSIRRNTEGQITGYQGIIRDITDLKKTADLKRAIAIAQRSAEMKSQFLANMSHEIRTPLNAIFGITNLLQDTTLTEQQRHYVDVVQSSTDHLLVLINDILDLSKFEAGKLRLDPVEFSLDDLLHELEDTIHLKVAQKQLRFTIKKGAHVPNYLLGDSVRLKQILLNLLSNALKFTEEGNVVLAIRLLEEKEHFVHLYFAVTDTGIGIPVDKQAIIFDSFTQGNDNTTRLFGGTGLGLAITKRLVEMQGGHITLRSEEGVGSTFSFTLKFTTTTGEQYLQRKAAEHQYQVKDLGDLRILLVEDNKVNQFVTSETISKWGTGLQIEVADNGQQALDKLREQEFDIILMDVQMPVMDGHTATKKIRQEFAPPKADVPILAMTAFATAGEADRCIASGMDDYIPKPFNPKNLYNKIAELTGRLFGDLINMKKEIPEEAKDIHEESPIINLRYLDTLAQGDEALRHQMLQVLVDESPDDLSKLRDLLNKKDWDRFASAAHKFKSSATFVGNKYLEKQLKTMELMARDRTQVNLLNDMLTEVEEIFDKALLLIREILHNEKQAD